MAAIIAGREDDRGSRDDDRLARRGMAAASRCIELGAVGLVGMRVRGYTSAVTLEEAPEGGTMIRWRSTYDHAGPLTSLVLRLAVRDACKRLAKAASA